MKAFIAFFKKELLGSIRSSKLTILGMLFVLFGFMNPVIAKITPLLMESLSESLAGSGITVTAMEISALDSWTQFFKNIPLVLIVFVLVYGNTFSSEYDSGAVVLLLTKGLKRYKVVLAKAANVLAVWSAGYLVTFGITFVVSEILWDNSVAVSLGAAVIYWWLFGVFVIALTIFFAALFRSYGVVLVGVGGSVLVLYIVSLWQKIEGFIPTSLMNSTAIVYGLETASHYIGACVIAAVLSVAAIAYGILVFNKKEM